VREGEAWKARAGGHYASVGSQQIARVETKPGLAEFEVGVKPERLLRLTLARSIGRPTADQRAKAGIHDGRASSTIC